ncbi:hypothetical protein ACU686_29585 [Yinghuangia aomiensis]
MPMIRLGSATTMDAVCAVFERVNTGGVPLNVFELLTATYAGNQHYVGEFGEYYRLPEAWGDIKKQLCVDYPVLGRIENGPDDGLSSSDFLQAVSLVLSWERKQAGLGSAVSCKRRDLLDLPLTEFRRLAPGSPTPSHGWEGSCPKSSSFTRRTCPTAPSSSLWPQSGPSSRTAPTTPRSHAC